MDSDVNRALIIMVMGAMGIIFAAVTKHLNDSGILIDEFITGSITITDVMTVIILVFFSCGVILAALRR